MSNRKRAMTLQDSLRSMIGGETVLKQILYDIQTLRTGLIPIYDQNNRSPVEHLFEPATKEQLQAINNGLTHQMKLLDKILPTQKALEVTDATEYTDMSDAERLARVNDLVRKVNRRAGALLPASADDEVDRMLN